MRVRYKAWSVPFIENNNDIIVNSLNLKDCKEFNEFIKRDNLVLEIGSGKGGFIMNMSHKFPEYNFLCVEKDVTCSAQGAKLFKENELKNVYVISGDIKDVFEHFNEPFFSHIFINHPDPWPKKKHYKRRLFYRDFLTEYKKLLKEDGELILKTDNDDFFEFAKEELEASNWEIIFINYNYNDEDNFDAPTNYEIKWREKNVPIKRLIAKYKGE